MVLSIFFIKRKESNHRNAYEILYFFFKFLFQHNAGFFCLTIMLKIRPVYVDKSMDHGSSNEEPYEMTDIS